MRKERAKRRPGGRNLASAESAAPSSVAFLPRRDLGRQDTRDVAAPLGKLPVLTPRECEVLERIAEGESTREVASGLFVSEQAITYHIGNLLSKFGCENRAGLVARAFVLGYLDSRSWPPRLSRRRTL
jgi:DNA-binding CsgD family transcriptional regulator